jgi:hypothetical protein
VAGADLDLHHLRFLRHGDRPAGDPVGTLGVVVLGLGIGGLFPLALTLPLDYSADPEEAGRLTAIAFFVGYIEAAVAGRGRRTTRRDRWLRDPIRRTGYD